MTCIKIMVDGSTVSVDKPEEEVTSGERVKWKCATHNWTVRFDQVSPLYCRKIESKQGQAGYEGSDHVRNNNAPGRYKYTVVVDGVGEIDPELIDEGEEKGGG